MEDVDEPRTQPGASGAILATLEACALEWDGAVEVQSRRTALYREALDRLTASGHMYPCGCTRKEIADSALATDGARIYPGTCRHGLDPGKPPRAFRVRTDDVPVVFTDRVQGTIRQSVAREAGDFVLFRADGYFAYQLAVVVDDAAQGITDIVRGADLLESTPRQIHLQRLLGLPAPTTLHLPVAVNAAGKKLSKQTGAAAAGPATLAAALAFLGHAPPAELRNAPPRELVAWGIAHWDVARIPKARVIGVSSPAG